MLLLQLLLIIMRRFMMSILLNDAGHYDIILLNYLIVMQIMITGDDIFLDHCLLIIMRMSIVLQMMLLRR